MIENVFKNILNSKRQVDILGRLLSLTSDCFKTILTHHATFHLMSRD